MSQSGHFGYKLPAGIVGEVSSTSNNIIRTGTATADMEFGQFVELTYRGIGNYDTADGIGFSPYTDALDLGIPTIGVAVYLPDRSNGKKTQYKYMLGDSVAIMTEGDVRLKVFDGDLCLMGDPCYLAFANGDYIVTATKIGAKFQIGTFAETKISDPTNSVKVALKVTQDVLVFPPLTN